MSGPVAAQTPWINAPRALGPGATVREVWHHRRFITYLGGRSMRKLYMRTRLGLIWIFVPALLPILIRVLVFGGFIGLQGSGIPYFLFLTIGTVPWTFFATALMWSIRGLEMNRGVLKHVYIPKVILPLASVTPALFFLLLNFAVLLLAVVFYWVKDGTPYITLGAHSVWSVVALLCVALLVLGFGFFLSPLAEAARDARFAMAQITSIWFLLTPVLYDASAVPPQHRLWLTLNPMASFIEAFKYGLLGTTVPDPTRFGIALAMTFSLFAGGLWFFLRRDDEDVED